MQEGGRPVNHHIRVENHVGVSRACFIRTRKRTSATACVDDPEGTVQGSREREGFKRSDSAQHRESLGRERKLVFCADADPEITAGHKQAGRADACTKRAKEPR